jgi:hypothetical protein
MRVEFPEIYQKFFSDGHAQYKEIKEKKKDAFKECMDEYFKKNGGYFSRLMMRDAADKKSSDEDEDEDGHSKRSHGGNHEKMNKSLKKSMKSRKTTTVNIG